MLLRFSVTNHRSLRDRQEISLVASSLDDDPASLIDCRQVPDRKLLPALVVYGANASGKSNLVDAMRWMRNAVLHSHREGTPGGGVPRNPFLLDPAAAAASSRADIDFVVDDVRYHYGFEATEAAFTAEWLFAFPHDRRQVLFERDGSTFQFGRHLKGRNHIISDLTRPNSLFLSAAAQNGHDDMTKLSQYFQDITVDERQLHELEAGLADEPLDPRVIEFLKAAGTGIIGSRIRRVNLPDNVSELQHVIGGVFSKFLNQPFQAPWTGKQATFLQLAHKGAGERLTYFELARESDGTRRLLMILVPLFQTLDKGSVMVLDELDASLHTQACEMIFALFSSPTTNNKGAQLIATTHDTNLLRSPHLRRDQVWLAEKDAEGASHLYPLTQFRTRKSDNLARGYLQGRYGAIPFARPVSDAPVTL